MYELTGAPPPEPGALPRVMTRAELIAHGYSRRAIDHRVRRGSWLRLLPRTYLLSDTITWPDRLAAAVCFAGPQALLTGAAALADTVLRSVTRPAVVHVLVPRSTTARSRAWVRITRTTRLPDPALTPGPRKAHTARAVADLARELRRLDDVRALVTEVVRRQRCGLAELTDELLAGPRRGSGHLRIALEDARLGAWSAPEARVGALLRRRGLPPFEQNAAIRLPGGGRFVADFLWRALRAILEIDSAEHTRRRPIWTPRWPGTSRSRRSATRWCTAARRRSRVIRTGSCARSAVGSPVGAFSWPPHDRDALSHTRVWWSEESSLGTPRAPARAYLSLLPSGPGEVRRVSAARGVDV